MEARHSPVPRRSARQRQKKQDRLGSPENRQQLSRRERRKRQGRAAKTATPRREERCQEDHPGCRGGRRPPGSRRTPEGWRREIWTTEEDLD